MATSDFTLWRGATAPEAFRVTCPANDTTGSLAGTTAASIAATWLDTGETATWTAAVVSAAADEAVVRRVLDGSETTRVGRWALVVTLTVDGAPRLTEDVIHLTIREIR